MPRKRSTDEELAGCYNELAAIILLEEAQAGNKNSWARLGLLYLEVPSLTQRYSPTQCFERADNEMGRLGLEYQNALKSQPKVEL